MTKPLRIVCAVDASPPAAAAFEQALALSTSHQAQLVVVHAVSRNQRYSWGAVERVASLAALRDRAEDRGVPVRVRVQQGDIAGVILLHAHAHAADLIVLGSHEPSGLASFRYRSIADRVVQGASSPVLLVPAAMTRPEPVFRRIVCAIDLSASPSTLVASLSRAAKDAARLAFLHVLRDRGRYPFRRLAGPAANTRATTARGQLHSLVDAEYPGAEVLVNVSANSVPDEILHVARKTDADLIALGATRHSGLRRRFRGSTALRVSRRSLVPVLVLPVVQARRELSALEEAVLGWAA